VNATGTGFVIFDDTNNGYHVAVANDAGTYRTVGSCFQLACLIDGTPPSTRSALIDSIMHFLGIGVVGVEERPHVDQPGHLALTSALPNPCSQEMTISYTINVPQDITLTIHDVTGRRIKTFVEGRLSAGSYATTWTSRDDAGRHVPAGIYFIRLEGETCSEIQKIVVLK